jgi:hypothetical protein
LTAVPLAGGRAEVYHEVLEAVHAPSEVLLRCYNPYKVCGWVAGWLCEDLCAELGPAFDLYCLGSPASLWQCITCHGVPCDCWVSTGCSGCCAAAVLMKPVCVWAVGLLHTPGGVLCICCCVCAVFGCREVS